MEKPDMGSIANLDLSTLFAPDTPQEGEGGATQTAASEQFADAGASQGGEAGQDVPPPPPPLPPSTPPSAGIDNPADPEDVADDVYRPAPKANPVLAALQKHGLYRKRGVGLRHEIACPWQGDHSNKDGHASYAEPDGASPSGRFECPECRTRHVGNLIEHLAIDPAVARCKPTIRNVKGEMHRIADAAERVLAKQLDYFHSGGTIVRLRRDQTSGDVSTEQVSEQTLAIALSAAADFEGFNGRTKAWERIDVPPRMMQSLLKKGDCRYLRELRGLARQPYFRAGHDKLVLETGYDAESGIFASFKSGEYDLPEPTEANAREGLKVLSDLISEFHFSSPADKSAAISAMLTAAIRPSLPLSPAFSISASRPGSGKSYLASLIACFGSPAGPYNTSYPTSTEEASKLVLSLMISSPAVVCFDDMTTDWMAYAAINRMLTSESVSDRILGSSRIATARTSTLILGTGNNIRPLKDMARRIVSVYLSPRVEDITSVRYSGNPVAKVKERRSLYVGHALTIIAAYLAEGSLNVDLPVVPSYDEWSKLCRESLIWLGECDPAASLIAQVNDDPDVKLFGDLLANWFECFGEKPTMVRTLIDKADTDTELREALLELPVVERNTINRTRLGRFLSRHANRIVNGLELRQAHNGERTAWTVIAIDENMKMKSASSRQKPLDPHRAWVKEPLADGGAAPGETF